MQHDNKEVKSNDDRLPRENHEDEVVRTNENGVPDIDAENFDDAGDIEGIQLGLLSNEVPDNAADQDQTLPSEQEKLSGDSDDE